MWKKPLESCGRRTASTRSSSGPEFALAPAISIDVAVMEPTDRGAVVSLDAGWNDVGSWESLWELSEQDPRGNVQVGDVVALDSADNYLRSEGPADRGHRHRGPGRGCHPDMRSWSFPATEPRTSRAWSRCSKVRAKAEEEAVDLLQPTRRNFSSRSWPAGHRRRDRLRPAQARGVR